MSNEIIKILDALAEKFGLAIDWTSVNVIPYLKQLCSKYVNYEIVTSVIWLIIGIACLFIVKYGINRTIYFYKKFKNNYRSDYDIYTFVYGLVTGLLMIIGLLIIGKQIFDIVTCIIFPEKIIIEELQSIYRGMYMR